MNARLAAIAAALALTGGAASYARGGDSVLPNGWIVRPPNGLSRETETMPQGAAASPDGTSLAVVTSGVNPAALLVYDVATLAQKAEIPLAGAFGRPLWLDADHVLVAGDNADALFNIDLASKSIRTIPMAHGSHPIAIAKSGGIYAVAGDGDGSVRIGALDELARARPTKIGLHPGPLVFSQDGRTVFATDRSGSRVVAIDRTSLLTTRISTGLHPSDLLIEGSDLYVAASDADAVDVIDTTTHRRSATIFVGDQNGGDRLSGSSPNALAAHDALVFVTLGAANSVAVLRDHRFVTRIAAGWYPTDVVPIGRQLYIIDGKGERTHANPRFNPRSTSNVDYIGAIQYGSIRTFDLDRLGASEGNPQGAVGWQDAGQDAVVRPHGPIKHVFFILKENRSYDQVLGDMSSGNGDPKLVWFGAKVTPNQHSLAKQFGLFDDTYTSGEVSDPGHNWSDAAFANDFVERFWPPTYGGRRDDDETFTGWGASTARNGYMWDAAAAAHVSFRDYGELATVKRLVATEPIAPTLHGRYDPNYVGWDLDYSDVDRVKEWSREFDAFEKSGTLPQLEYIWLPNDHTYGSRPGKLTPVALVAQNDYALGLIVQKISHSPAWSSSAVFIIEDDSQDGADHVSDQRTTFYLASPFARGGVIHDHYATVSVLRTIEIILGMRPLSTYDAMAVPLYHAFSATANAPPFRALRPMVDITAKNSVTAFGARVSETLDFSRPDATPPGILFNILAHNRSTSHR
ncbi:MAG TPA: alkaline phosphatase family protein [Candidatus Eremiobacteraceae bacterium]|nr:alkaline phosphatase family protein [Candidatus Eremiobacteraceae bacterium]